MTIYSKTENGFEIQDSCCGVSGIMMRLKIVKEETEHPSTDRDEESDVMLHGVKILKQLISSWPRSECFVCVDFYFTFKIHSDSKDYNKNVSNKK